MQYRAQGAFWETRDRQLQFRSGSNGVLYAYLHHCSMDDARPLVKSGLIGYRSPAVIQPGERRRWLRAAAAVMADAGLELDTRCRKFTTWKSIDDEWILTQWRGANSRKSGWEIHSNRTNVYLPVQTPNGLFHTRDEAVEWARVNVLAE